MTPNSHRAPSRLATSRPASRWKSHSTLPSDRGASPNAAVRTAQDYELEQDILDGITGASLVEDDRDAAIEASSDYDVLENGLYDDQQYDEPLYDERPVRTSYAGTTLISDVTPETRPASAPRANGHNGTKPRGAVAEGIEADYLPPETPARSAVEPDVERYDFDPGSRTLSASDQYQLLLHNIQLYDDEWKLAQISNHKIWLRAALVPRYKKIDLDQARKSGRLLQIAIDNQGNTIVREPKKPGLLRRLLNWLYGR